MRTNDFSEEKTVIPDIDDPLGKYWKQPETKEIILNGGLAIMNRAAFEKLHDYSNSRPSALYIGKMWKERFGADWILRWCSTSYKGAEYIEINLRLIVVSQ